MPKDDGVEKSASVVLLDDGELDRVRVILERIGADFALARRPASPREIPAARELLVTTVRRALELGPARPREDVAAPPVWLCVHGHDFGALRSQLRELGVHYLVHSSVDQETLRLLIGMLLHDRGERRTRARLPLGREMRLKLGSTTLAGKLVELSATAARVRVDEAVEAGDWVSLELPRELRGSSLDALSGHVSRAEREGGAGGRASWNVAIELDPLSPEANTELESILRGDHPGTLVSVLREPPARAHGAEPAAELAPAQESASAHEPEPVPIRPSRERRRSERRAYRRRVAALTAFDADAPQVVLGHDLSAEGIRIARQPGMVVGQRLALGLYGAAGRAPLVIEATVVCDHGARGLGIAFQDVKPEQRRLLEELVATLAPLESLVDDAQTVVVSSRLLETRLLTPEEVEQAERSLAERARKKSQKS